MVMEQRKLATKFAQLRLPRVLANNSGPDTDRLFRFRPSAASMDQLVHDFNTALDETAGSNSSSRSTTSRRKAWKRRCKSTSNLLLAGQNVSDDSSSSVDNVGLLSRDRGTSSLQFSDSDLDVGEVAGVVRGSAGRTRQTRLNDYRGHRYMTQLGVESDSFTENVSPFKEFRSAGSSRRKRKFKRMAVDQSPENRKPGLATKRKKVRSKCGHESVRGSTLLRKGAQPGCGFLPGKRKRSAREKSVESGEVLSSGRSRTASLGEEASLGLIESQRMELEEVGSSSSLSSSEWEDVDSDASPEGEADDEQSDWPGPEPGVSLMQLTDEELDPEITFSQLIAGPSHRSKGQNGSRVIRSGTRRLKRESQPSVSNPGPPHHNSAVADQVSRFVHDESKQSLRLPALRLTDRNMILNLASLYNLSWRSEGPNILILAKPNKRENVELAEFAVPGVPASSRGHGQLKLRERKSTDIKRQRRTPPLSSCTPGVPPGVLVSSAKPGERRHSGRQRNKHQAEGGSKSS